MKDTVTGAHIELSTGHVFISANVVTVEGVGSVTVSSTGTTTISGTVLTLNGTPQ